MVWIHPGGQTSSAANDWYPASQLTETCRRSCLVRGKNKTFQAANGVSVQLPIDQSDIDAALATARTPQEAARTFAKLVTPAIAQAVAEALQRTLERTQAATDAIANPTTQDMFSSSANSALRLGPTEPNSRSANANPQSPIAGWPNIVLQNGLLMAVSYTHLTLPTIYSV